MNSRALWRALVVGATGLTVAVVNTGTAAAGTSTFSGRSYTGCSRPPAPSYGTSTGSGLCTTEGAHDVCVTGVDVGEAAVVADCGAYLDATTSLFFVQFRPEQNGPVHVYCFGTGSGTLYYKASPSAEVVPIPVVVSVEGTVATFSGVAVAGVQAAVVSGTYTVACGGYGVFAGEVL